MPSSCCIPGCNSNYKIGDSVKVFKFPAKGTFRHENWLKSIPRKDWTPGSRSAVCIFHFRDTDVIKEDSVVRPDGSVLTVPRGKFKLKENAVPSIFPNLNVNLKKAVKNERQDPTLRQQRNLDREQKKVKMKLAECKNRWASIRDSFPETTEPRKKHKSGEVPYTPSIYDEDDIKPLGITSTEKTSSHLIPSESSMWSADYTNYTDQSNSQQGAAINFPEIKVEVESFDEEDKSGGNDPTTENGKCNFPYIVPNSLCEVATDIQPSVSTKRTLAESDEGARSKKRHELSSTESESKETEHKKQEHPIETFFKSMAATVLTFPPHLMAVAKLNVCRLITELELRALAEKKAFDGNQDKINELLSENIVGMCSTSSATVENGVTNQEA